MKETIRIQGCRVNNLQNLSLEIEKGRFTVVTGVSGSGKSSLAFDTIFIEGQRRYLESLSLEPGRQLPKPDVDFIEGLSPTLAVAQSLKALSHSSTVASLTGLQKLLEVLYIHYGVQHSPSTGKPLSRQSRAEIVENIMADYPKDAKLRLLAPFPADADRLQRLGFIRVLCNGKEIDLSHEALPKADTIDIVIDRIINREGIRTRLSDSVGLALETGGGIVRVEYNGDVRPFTEVFLCPETGETFDPATLNPYKKLEGLTYAELTGLPLSKFPKWKIKGPLAEEVLPRIQSRLETLSELGLSRLSLDRTGDTLSIGEAQRIQLTAHLGSRLSGVIYVLDEPSRGLHPEDTKGLIKTLHSLTRDGNTLIVVEHNPDIIAAADHVIELGPGAGRHGGRLIFEGPYKTLLKQETPTGRWLSGKETMPPRKKKRKPTGFIEELPLGVLVAITGKSGSGKSTLVKRLAPLAMQRVISVDQRVAGTSLRSMPATYINLMSHLRTLFSQTTLARARGYTASHFTLSRKGGRCEACEGLGEMRIRADFLPEMWTPCELCHGKRYNEETLQVHWKGHSIADVLALSVEEALPLFDQIPELERRLSLLQELGLEYLQLGQRSTTLSGGELQRLKLVSELAKKTVEPTLYILDEPTVGLHLHDIEKLARILHKLTDKGHSVWLVDNQPLLLQQADHAIAPT